MNNWKPKAAAAAVALCLLPGLALADAKVSFRLHGGWAYISGGDINHGTQAMFDWVKFYLVPGNAVQEGGYKPLHRGYEVGGDLIFGLTRTLGIGVGAGYTKMSRELFDSWHRMYDEELEYYIYEIFEGAELKAMSIRLGLFLTLPIAGKIELTASAGISGYLQARYQADWLIIRRPIYGFDRDPSNMISTRAEQKRLPVGFQAGTGVEYRLLPKISLFAEARGRYARFRGLEGTSTSEPGEWGAFLPVFSEQGKLYYESVPLLPDAPRLIMVQSAPPAGPDGKPRQAVVDLSGVSLQAGIRIFF